MHTTPALNDNQENSSDLPFTGERFVPALYGKISLEHWHRYLVACKLSTDKIVLDIACGEGYGSNMLANCAHKVYGVDVSSEAITAAAKKYSRENLAFLHGDCAAIPLDDNSVDLVVSFETIEHLRSQEKAVSEFRRVLRPDGVLILSSPNRYFSEKNFTGSNKYHLKELYPEELISLLTSSFALVRHFRQQYHACSVITANVGDGNCGGGFDEYVCSDGMVSPASPEDVQGHEYDIVIASNTPVNAPAGGFLHYKKQFAGKGDDSIFCQAYGSGTWTFQEGNSTRLEINTETNRVKFDFTAESGTTNVRFDPGDFPCIVTLLNVKAEFFDRTLTPLFPVDHSAHFSAGRMFIFLAEDPKIYFSAPYPIKSLTVHADIHLLISPDGLSDQQKLHHLMTELNRCLGWCGGLDLSCPQNNSSFGEEKIQRVIKQIRELRKQLYGVRINLWELKNGLGFMGTALFSRLGRLRRRFSAKKDLLESGLFDPEYYYAENKDDVIRSELAPLDHFLQIGWAEQRNPSDIFSFSNYKMLNEDVARSNCDPLIHYILYGRREGRATGSSKPTPSPRNALRLRVFQYIQRFSIFLQPHLLRYPRLYAFAYNVFFWGKRWALKFLASEQSRTKAEFKHIFSLSEIHYGKIQNGFPDLPSKVPVNVFIPVYVPNVDSFSYLQKLCAGLFRNTSARAKILFIDDASPYAETKEYLRRQASMNSNVEVLFSENNCGFVKTVNKALKKLTGHVIVLNMDTEVPPGWVERMVKPFEVNPLIASVTPFTNDAEIASFPEICQKNQPLYGLATEKIDSVFSRFSGSVSLAMPTGIGFCMAMSQAAIHAVGLLDEESFGRGYGEETDWCNRAAQEGYINVIAIDVFVCHKHGGVSFMGEERKRLITEHNAIIASRYPKYTAAVHDFINRDPLAPYRFIAKLNLSVVYAGVGMKLIFDHGIGGGAETYVNNKVSSFRREAPVCLVRYNRIFNCFQIRMMYLDDESFINCSNIADFFRIIKEIPIQEIIINELVTWPTVEHILSCILSLAKNSGAKLVYLLHDYFCICKEYTLMNESGKYCFANNNPQIQCQTCKIFSPAMVQRWRSSWEFFLNECTEIVVFSEYVKHLLLCVYPNLRASTIKIIPHVLPYIPRKVTLRKSKNLTVAVIGGINVAKGASVVYNLLQEFERRGEGRILVVGSICEYKNIHNHKRLQVTGPYTVERLPDILEAENISVCLFPSVWPETFSYVVDEIIAMELPLIAFNLGAPAERIGHYAKGKLLSAEITASELTDELFRMGKDSLCE